MDNSQDTPNDIQHQPINDVPKSSSPQPRDQHTINIKSGNNTKNTPSPSTAKSIFLHVTCRSPSLPIILLIAVMAWYIYIVASYSGTSNEWLTAVVMSALVGTILNVNAYAGANPDTNNPNHETFFHYIYENRIPTIRFYIIPFCVSSYSGIAQTNHFNLAFPTDGTTVGIGIAIAFGVGIGFVIWHSYTKRFRKHHPEIFPDLRRPPCSQCGSKKPPQRKPSTNST